jgi:hypothetical protein
MPISVVSHCGGIASNVPSLGISTWWVTSNLIQKIYLAVDQDQIPDFCGKRCRINVKAYSRFHCAMIVHENPMFATTTFVYCLKEGRNKRSLLFYWEGWGFGVTLVQRRLGGKCRKRKAWVLEPKVFGLTYRLLVPNVQAVTA